MCRLDVTNSDGDLFVLGQICYLEYPQLWEILRDSCQALKQNETLGPVWHFLNRGALPKASKEWHLFWAPSVYLHLFSPSVPVTPPPSHLRDRYLENETLPLAPPKNKTFEVWEGSHGLDVAVVPKRVT